MKQITLTCARDCITGDAHNSFIKVSYRTEVRGKAGKVIHTVSFKDVVTITAFE